MLIKFFHIKISTFQLTIHCTGVEKKETDITTDGLQPIDIRAPAFFWLLQPWKEGTLATIDGWGRFAEISFVGANQMRIRPLVEFPRMQLDRRLITWPEAGIITSTTSERMHHIAAIDDGITKTHIPLLTWAHIIAAPVLLDSKEGLIGYKYSLDDGIEKKLFVYNYKEDRMIHESSGEFAISISIAMNEQYAMGQQGIMNGNRRENREVFYNWRNNEIVENDLTKSLTHNNVDLILRPDRTIHIGRRYLVGYSGLLQRRIKVTWDEEYSDIKITPLSYLVPTGRGVSEFILSSDGLWSSTLVWGYRGIRNEDLCKRAFFHMDDRYPNGISMPIFTEDYENFGWDYGVFVNHPVHGLCFAQEWHKDRQQYLRLYKMSDVLAEINRQMSENADEIGR